MGCARRFRGSGNSQAQDATSIPDRRVRGEATTLLEKAGIGPAAARLVRACMRESARWEAANKAICEDIDELHDLRASYTGRWA